LNFGAGWFWVAQRFTAAIKNLIKFGFSRWGTKVERGVALRG
jgi:hypothetical protein